MKKVTSIISAAGLLVVLSSGISMSAAHAEDHGASCSAGNPCGQYAVVDPSGVVTNVIICQATVCGGGTFAGNKVVLQVPTSSDGSGNPASPGYISPQGQAPVTYNSHNNTFNVPNGGGTIQAPSQVSTTFNPNKTSTTTQLDAQVCKDGVLQAPTSLNGLPSSITGTATSCGIISGIETHNDSEGNTVSSATQSQTFAPGLSHDEMMAIINSNLSNYLIIANAESLVHLLFTIGY
jgi:hypothetical protein